MSESAPTYDTKKFIKFLNSKWINQKCILCGKRELVVEDKAFELRQFHGGNMVVAGSVLGVIPITCSNCGNTIFINGNIAKVFE